MTSIICSVRGCHNNWKKRRMSLSQRCFEHQKLRYECCGPAFNLHPPPAKEERLQGWLQALNLKHPPRRPYVCSFHFVEGKPTTQHPYPEKWLGYETPQKGRQRDESTTTAAGETDKAASDSEEIFLESWHMIDHNYAASPLLNPPLRCDQGTQCHGASEIYMQLLRNNHLSLLYTGLPLDAFFSLTEQLTRDYRNTFQLDACDQILMTLMKLRLNLLQDDLAERFRVCQPEVAKIISLWLDVMEKKMRGYIPWLPKETLQATMPQTFREHFPSTTCVIVCLETPLQKPCSLDSRGKKPHSHYYSHNTIKYLVAMAPSGLIMFISIAYGGRCSDKYITSDSGFLEYLRPGDVVMAQRGFLIENLLHERKVKLLPALNKDGTLLLSEEDTNINTNTGSSTSIERVIRRLKNFRVIAEIVPFSLVDKFDKILRICVALCNLHREVVQEDDEF